MHSAVALRVFSYVHDSEIVVNSKRIINKVLFDISAIKLHLFIVLVLKVF